MRELYRLVLVDTPLAPYFSECITSEDLDDMNIEIMRNTLYKAYLEDFYRFCQIVPSPAPAMQAPVAELPRVKRRRIKYDQATVLTNEFMKKAIDDTSNLKRKRKGVFSFLGVWKLNNAHKKEKVLSDPLITGQPKRHLLTTGWSMFVGAKRLKAGDAVLFIRACPSEFVIPLARYRKSIYATQLSVGMRFGMMFEPEESGKRRYMGTIVGISDVDPLRWPGSKWHNLLQ